MHFEAKKSQQHGANLLRRAVLMTPALALATRGMAEPAENELGKSMGAEASAFWRTSPDGQDAGYGYFSAVLRDWGRLAVLMTNDGRVGGHQVISKQFLLDATDPSRQPKHLRPRVATPFAGYDYQFWLHPFRQRTFAMMGVYGQAMFVQPSTGIAMVVMSVWPYSSAKQDPQPSQEREALWRGVLRSLGGDTGEI